jgi:DNA modification methylase
MSWQIRQGDWIEVLRTMPDESVHCVVTSPPYWGLRDYGVSGQLGLERTPDEYVAKMVEGFREVRRVLRNDGTLWLNLGDSYSEKSLVGTPWLVALALKGEGWFLRADVVWAKRNCMPESVTDRPTRSHEFIFLMSKSSRYFYDSEAIKELSIWDVDGTGTAHRKARQRDDAKSIPDDRRSGIRPAGYKDSSKFGGKNGDKQSGHGRRHGGFNARWDASEDAGEACGFRNKRDVWTIAPAQFPESHFATFPQEIPETCIKAGCPENGTVLDPFNGAGTTGLVATRLGRNYIGIELNPEYIAMATKRIENDAPLFNMGQAEAPTGRDPVETRPE